MTEYLLDANYSPIESNEIPSDMELVQAYANIDLLHRLIARLIVERAFMKSFEPQIEEYEHLLSGDSFPYMLSVGLGEATVCEFLQSKTEDVVVMTQNLKIALIPLVDIFTENQLCRALKRLGRLNKILTETLKDSDTMSIDDDDDIGFDCC